MLRNSFIVYAKKNNRNHIMTTVEKAISLPPRSRKNSIPIKIKIEIEIKELKELLNEKKESSKVTDGGMGIVGNVLYYSGIVFYCNICLGSFFWFHVLNL